CAKDHYGSGYHFDYW
nr:immunoglobulin heavy chain junction region [Macaca mulatta]MOV49311.1 immunoglobulin heavy chain junction region [Macaca mulatta]MOV49407.1 immunoglobulin heavy chain junction region [Macaca mulatta]MOV51675.1 immunoglobulin heavy chain junction region [Macaca mulatta]MOV52524.1 immunoglobulin heavy chain junction region [Macaca mulatta]